MRRKLGILFLIGITVFAGTQEATRQFDALKSSLKNFTRASLWSGLIVYAQPVSDGKLPSPQIYYLMPPPQQRQQPSVAQQQQPALAHNGATSAPKHEAVNNHGAEAATTTLASNTDAVMLAATRADEDAANSELVLNKLPMNSIASHFAPPPQPARQPAPPPQPDRVRMYEEVAKNAQLAARKFKRDADLIERVYVKELDAAKLIAETERLLVEQGHLEHLKLGTLGEAENLRRRMDIRVVRRAARSERLDRLRVNHRPAGTRGVALPEMSSIGCEKMRATPEVVPAPPAAPLAATKGVRMIVEPDVELALPAASNATGNSWTLNCDTEPEQK